MSVWRREPDDLGDQFGCQQSRGVRSEASVTMAFLTWFFCLNGIPWNLIGHTTGVYLVVEENTAMIFQALTRVAKYSCEKIDTARGSNGWGDVPCETMRIQVCKSWRSLRLCSRHRLLSEQIALSGVAIGRKVARILFQNIEAHPDKISTGRKVCASVGDVKAPGQCR
jgi:hypothetical protein